jgi:hypothetical protein
MRIPSMLFGVLLFVWLPSAEAAEVFVASIAGPRTGSPATGHALVTLRDDLSAIDYIITFTELSSPEYMSHIHRGDDEIALWLPMGTPKVGTWTAPSADDIAQLRNEQLYVNIHSEYYPTGEIRGTLRRQALPVKTSTWSAIKALYR